MIDNVAIGLKIKKLRKNNNLSQQELADKLHVSFQAVSNWERGTTQIDINNLLELSKAFNVSVDYILSKDSSYNPLYIGIDGGGTKTEFVVFDEEGKVKLAFKTTASNPNDIGMDKCLELLKININKCISLFPNIKYVFGGIAGLLTGNNLEIVSKSLAKSFPSLVMEFDSDIANLFNSFDGIKACLIMGTGSVLFIEDKDKRIQFGGWGYLLDDYGSGYDIGREAIRIFLKDSEEEKESSFITKLIKDAGFDKKDLISSTYLKGKTYVASFAHFVFEAYKNHDVLAKEIIINQTNYLSSIIDRAASFYDFGDNILLSGGIIDNYKDVLIPLFKTKNKYNYITLNIAPILGACKKSLSLSNLSNKDFENDFISSYKEYQNETK